MLTHCWAVRNEHCWCFYASFLVTQVKRKVSSRCTYFSLFILALPQSNQVKLYLHCTWTSRQSLPHFKSFFHTFCFRIYCREMTGNERRVNNVNLEKALVRVRKMSWFGLKYLLWSPQKHLEIVELPVKNRHFRSPIKHLEIVWLSMKNSWFWLPIKWIGNVLKVHPFALHLLMWKSAKHKMCTWYAESGNDGRIFGFQKQSVLTLYSNDWANFNLIASHIM